MPKIYVLTEGEYSDYCIVGIFSTREKCEFTRNGNQAAQCECYELDEFVEDVYCRKYTTAIIKETGEIVDVRNYDHLWLIHPTKAVIDDEGIVWIGPPMEMIDEPHIKVESPISMEHAVKVAIEARQKWLREGGHARRHEG